MDRGIAHEEGRMTTPSADELARFHRWFAVECNNGAWALADRPDRSAADDRLLREMAHAAMYHWSFVGTAVNAARGEVTLAHALAVLGDGAAALAAAERALALLEGDAAAEAEDWDVAFAQAELAHAAAVLGDIERHRRHRALAAAAGAAIADDEDRAVFQAELAKLPAR